MMRLARLTTWAMIAMLATACSTSPPTMPAPPRATTAAPIVEQPSYIAVPITARVVELEKALNARVPRTLWQIDETKKACVPAQRIFKGKLKITPDISCRIVGTAVRGPIKVGGSGEVLTISMPVSVQVAAKDIGRIIKSETATAAARVRATARLGMTANWQPTAKVDIDYSWTQVPGIELLGQRVKFARKVDPRLQKVVADLERTLPAEIARLNARRDAESAWRKGFTVLELNAKNPPVWLRVTPKRIAYGGYKIIGGDIQLYLTATALTETFVGPRPEARAPTPLPPLGFDRPSGNAKLFVPVIASYAELEPVLSKALGKLAKKGIVIPDVGQVAVQFGKVTIYGTDGGRLAVGIEIHAESPRKVLTPNGTVWLTGVPVNEPGSRVVRVRDLTIGASTDSPATNLLAAIALSPAIAATLQEALTENFERDYQKVLGKANAALASKRTGDFLLSAVLTKVDNGRVTAYGEGLYMPVTGTGAAMIRYVP
ncbi:MAG: DUF4403 family protein [Sphingomonadales bacterium]